MREIEMQSINTIRMLSVDQIEKANSGHPGICMGAAPMAYTLFNKHININPENSKWFNRDRFILSADMVQHFYIQCYIYVDLM